MSQTGFTGDVGYELWMDPEAAESVWDGLMQAGNSRGICAIGSQELNIARLEAGFLSPRVDFVSTEHTIRLGRDRSPLELGLDWLVRLDVAGKREIGSVTSAAWSPTCKRNIALAMVNAPHFRMGSTLWADIYLNRELVWERRMSRAEVMEGLFFAPARRRATPPAEY